MNGFLVGIGLGLVILGILVIGFISLVVALILLDKLEKE